MTGIRNLLIPVCCCCGIMLAGYLFSHMVDVSEPDFEATAGGLTHNSDLADSQRSTVTSFSQGARPGGSTGVIIRSSQPNSHVERPIVESDSAINIGAYLDPDEPYLSGTGIHAEINLGAPVEVYPPAYQGGDGVSQDLGVPIDVDCLDCGFTDSPYEYRNIGPELSLEEYYHAENLPDGESQNIGPDIDIESYLADK